jgi:hypothetical protein
VTGKPCTKVRFPTLAAAEHALFLARLKRALNPMTRRREQRAYVCRECAAWHLTSQPSRKDDTS